MRCPRQSCAVVQASLILSGLYGSVLAAETSTNAPAPPSPWGPYVEAGTPFFSSVLEGRKLGPDWPTNNLAPRALVLQLGEGAWAAFDTDLLRIAAVWQGSETGVTPVSMSQISYHKPGAKVSEGEKLLPEPMGTPWIANGLYPGWQWGVSPSWMDPRLPTQDPRQVGRGPLPVELGRFRAVRETREGVVLEYTIGTIPVQERWQARRVGTALQIQRQVTLENVTKPLLLLVGKRASTNGVFFRLDTVSARRADEQAVASLESAPGGYHWVSLRPTPSPVTLTLTMEDTGGGKVAPRKPAAMKKPNPAPPAARWPQTVTTSGVLSDRSDAYVVDNIPLPLDNPWKRDLRLADLTFLGPGHAAAVSFDGDVWMISGLDGDLKAVQWHRYATGFHEPLSLCQRDGRLFVFDRNGIWRVVDRDGNGEADGRELFCNAFTQGAETREYAHSLRAAPDGSFVLSKGGIQMAALGTHNGSVLRVAPDGSRVDVLGHGLRSPFIGVDPQTGLVTASDQQGNYVPSTPIHVIEGGTFHGFLSVLLPKEVYPAPIAEPLVWIPYPINPSGAGQVWLRDARMGPLNDTLIHIGYYRPELFAVLLKEREGRREAAVVSLTRDLAFAPLNGAVNPADGQLYVIGLQIWGSVAKQASGLARFRYTGALSTLPLEIAAVHGGVVLAFDVALDPSTAADPANYALERWNLQRTSAYGSPHFKLDGTKGQEWVPVQNATLAADGKHVFLSVNDMKASDQLRIGWSLRTQDGAAFEHTAYLTPRVLAAYAPENHGFAVDPSRAANATTGERRADAAPSVAEGRRVAELMGCASCHSTDGSLLGKVGPSWKGLYGSSVALADGRSVVADAVYLRESILHPADAIVAGYDKSETSMPAYEGLLTPGQLESLVQYLETLK